MHYTNNQIKRILSIQEFLCTANTLSKIYIEYDDKQPNADNIIEKQRIYKLFCSAYVQSNCGIKSQMRYLKIQNLIIYFNKM